MIAKFDRVASNVLGRIYTLRHNGKTADFGQVTASLRSLEPPRPQKTIVLCTDERTGSHLLAQLLASTGVLGRAYEYFNTQWMKRHYPDYPEAVPDQLVWAKKLGTTPNGIFSLKLHVWTLDRVAGAINIRRDIPNPVFVLLRREDLLGQAISLVKAHYTLAFTSWSEVKGKPVYDAERLRATVQGLAVRRERWEIFFARTGIIPYRVDYSRLVERPYDVVFDIRKHAGIKERAIVNRHSWYHFEKQADSTNEEWRDRFINDFGADHHLDVFDPEVLRNQSAPQSILDGQ
jgi:LPS sulfotransferase NodH